MQDFCFKTTDQASLTAVLETLGLAKDGQVLGDWMWVGRVVETPGVYAEDGAETTAPTYHDGEYAVYRATDDQAAIIEAAAWPEGVEVVDPPARSPRFGGEWLQPDMDALKTAAIETARDNCQAALAALASRFSDLERQTWSAQLAEAEAILQDTSPTAEKYPVIGGIIAVTGETFAAFAMAVQANNEAWSATSANIIGQRQSLVAKIKNCSKPSKLRELDLSVTVPA